MVVTVRYWWLPDRYRSLLLVPTFSMNATTHTLEKNIFAAVTFKDLWVVSFQTE